MDAKHDYNNRKILLGKVLPHLLPVLIIFFQVSCGRNEGPVAPPPPKVTVSQPVVREIIEWDEYTGRLEAVESVEVRARVSGYLESIHFQDGQIVKKGDLLFVIDPRPYQAELDQAEAELELAKARLKLAQDNVVRAKKLLSARAISEEEADTRISDERVARATVEQAEAAVQAAKLNVEFTQVRAPITGRISRKLVTEGNLINGGTGGTLLTTIVSLDPIYCYAEADEQSFLKYTRLAQQGKRPSSRQVRNPAYLALADEEGFPHKGYIDFVDNQLDPNTGTIRGRAVFPNPDLTLTPGLFARIRIPGSSKYEAIMIPDEAIGSDQSQRFVMIVNDENTAEYRKVVLGPKVNGLRIIREGLKPEDWVIVKGLQRVRPGVKVDPQREKIPLKNENFLTPDLTPTQAESNKSNTGG
ncbi:MAG TPA: efflux RND transporter periplasmic adaptor subunit [Thermodesulfobacteriota bacterium]|nr:efflux RND transporter periplasmic adaptor subunit [Thermodesulfobacteriota bacterium]